MCIVPTLNELKNFPTGFFDLKEQVRPSVGGIQVNMVDALSAFVGPPF
ncbi:MAG: hypothetical protein IPJ07_21415 [Acidobacteria bacterium]|nr:hypothetical protein [Acidobacteriota bacterium]